MLSFAAAIVSFLGLSWSNESWRIPGALVGTACMITAVYYAGAAGLWYGSEAASAGPRYSAWYSVHPLHSFNYLSEKFLYLAISRLNQIVIS